MSKGKFGCPVCNIEFGDLKTWEIHVAGKKHQFNQHRAEVLRKREENGLFIAGFPQKVRTENLQLFLERFGEVIDFYHNIDKNFVLATYREKCVLHSLVILVDQKLRVSLSLGLLHYFTGAEHNLLVNSYFTMPAPELK